MKKIIKNLFISASVLFMSSGIFALETDISLYNEMNSAYNSQFYPGCVQYADRLIEQFPDSVFVSNAYAAKGESLVRMGQYIEAEEVLKKAWKSSDEKSSSKAASVYWLGRNYELQKNYDNALIFYYDYCKNNGEKGKYYHLAVLNSGRVFYFQEEYAKAVPQFEYCIKNGSKYDRISYEDSLLKLADSYNKSNQSEKTIQLYSKFSEDQLSVKTYWLLAEYTGDAYVLQKKYKTGYELYCKVLACPEKSLAANALKKAYKVSTDHKNEVGTDPGTVLQTAQKNLSDSSELLAEFWTRMGTDAFNEGDYKKASSYFDEAEKTAGNEVLEFIATYRSEIALGKNPDSKSAEAAEKILNEAEEKYAVTKESRFFQQYNKLHIKYECILNQWEKAKARKADVTEFDYSTKYYLAMAEYNSGDYAGAAGLLKDSDSMLYALTLARQQKLKESASVFGSVDSSAKLSDEQRLNYAKVLLYSGRYREAQIEAAKCPQAEGKYILGLAQFNTRSWKYAEESFHEFLKKGSKDKTAVSYAQFYLGYSKYRLGKSEEAYRLLSSFADTYPKHELIWNGRMTASEAAVQSKNYEAGIKQAEEAIKVSKTDENRQEAVLLCSEIYVDAQNYEKAVQILKPYTTVKNEFAMKCLFQIARIYERQKELSEADKIYSKVTVDYGNKKLGEEALYRRGELYYSQEKFEEALSRFNEYIKKYPAGSFIDSSVFYSADCLAKTEKLDKAVMQYKSLIKNYPDSSYVYIASKNLMELYRQQEKYLDSLNTANLIIEKYGEQAKTDGINDFVKQVEKLREGYTEEIITQQLIYEQNGGSKKPEGRVAGTDLVKLLCAKDKLYQEGIALAKELLPLQQKNLKQESLYAALNSKLIAKDYKKNNSHPKAAKIFFDAAEYFRTNGLDNDSASCLYEAYDSFMTAGMTGDAAVTAQKLKELYPDTKYARSIKE